MTNSRNLVISVFGKVNERLCVAMNLIYSDAENKAQIPPHKRTDASFTEVGTQIVQQLLYTCVCKNQREKRTFESVESMRCAQLSIRAVGRHTMSLLLQRITACKC